MKKYLVGFIVGLSISATLTFAVSYSDINWRKAYKDREFKKAIIRIIEDCEIDGTRISC